MAFSRALLASLLDQGRGKLREKISYVLAGKWGDTYIRSQAMDVNRMGPRLGVKTLLESVTRVRSECSICLDIVDNH